MRLSSLGGKLVRPNSLSFKFILFYGRKKRILEKIGGCVGGDHFSFSFVHSIGCAVFYT